MKNDTRLDVPGHRTRPPFTPERRARFIAKLSETGTVRLACQLADVSRSLVEEVRRTDPDFAASWDEALQDFADRLEEVAWSRAMQGYKRPVFYKGKKIGDYTHFSDRLLLRLLEAHRPERFRRSPAINVFTHVAGPEDRDTPRERLAQRLVELLAEGDAEKDSDGSEPGGAGD